MLTRRTLLATGLVAATLPVQAADQPLDFQGPLGDVVLGNPDAKVTVIEYASLTCSHCKSFHDKTWPQFKARYVDTGKVRFILREFPLDALALAAAMLVRCQGRERHYANVDFFFDNQAEWAFSQKPVEALTAAAAKRDMSKDEFEACLKNETIFQGIGETRKNAMEKLQVNSTPTFFVNGTVVRGDQTIEQFDALLKPLL